MVIKMNFLDPTHRFHRRAFLAGSATVSLTTAASLLFAEELFGAPDPDSTKPNPALEKLGAIALAEAKKQGATYCDIRINRYRNQFSGYRMSPERGGSKTDEVPYVNDGSSFGFGVRVIARGQWGFAGSPLVTPAEIARITREAVTVAKANSVLQAAPVQLAPTKGYVDRWTSPFQKDPFTVPVDEKLELVHSAAKTVKNNPKVFSSFGGLFFHSEDKYFASTEGSSIQQLIIQSNPFLDANAVDSQKGISRDRSYQVAPQARGWEYVLMSNLGENARRIADEVVEHLSAPPVTAGKKDLVLLPATSA